MADPADLPGLTAAISADLTAASIPHAVSGGIAMAAHGYVHATVDLDVLVVTPSVCLPEVFEVFRKHGFRGEDRALVTALRERFVATLEAGPTTAEILVPVLPYHHAVLQRAVIKRCAAGRAKDLADLHALIAIAGNGIDAGYVRSTLGSILPADDSRHAEIDALLRGAANPPSAS